MGDFCDYDGARKLKEKIEEYWKKKGRDPGVRLVDAGFAPVMRSARTDVRSQMVNGMPPKKQFGAPAKSSSRTHSAPVGDVRRIAKRPLRER